ncbi:unnamed protein product, partial [Scytosiphon promiscuus]
MTLVSIRLGAFLVALAPIMLASVMQGRNELLERLRHTATHDPLTGAGNRDAFRAGVEHLLAERRGSFAVMMIDLDHFKAVNDRLGHAMGDRVLVSFARHVRTCLRPEDLLGRLGGEEFAVLVPGCGEQDAVSVAERMRAAASEPVALDDGGSRTVTASVGLLSVEGSDGESV